MTELEGISNLEDATLLSLLYFVLNDGINLGSQIYTLSEP